MNYTPEDSEPSHRVSPVLNIDRDMENQNRRRNERVGNHVNPRDRLFHALFIKIGHVYSRVVPKQFRLFLEVVVLVKGLLLFSILSYLHFSFGRVPLNCLNSTNGSWPRDGILRVQIQPEVRLKQQLPRFYSSEENRILFHPCHNSNMYTKQECATLSKDIKAFYNYKTSTFYKMKSQCYRLNLSDFMTHQPKGNWKDFESFEYVAADKTGKSFAGFKPGEIISEANLLSFYNLYLAFSEPERHYIFEYSQEFGFLRLSQETRKRLKIPVKVVNLDPNTDKCFGDSVSHFVLKYFLGYDDVVMNSIKKIADIENNTGYMLNVMTGDHYKFVSWGIGRSSYFISLLLMFLFTISISTLLRYCHQQVFFFIIHVLRMMDMNVVLAFPIAPLFTVILSLVGMETIMSEYFNDTTTSFYIILLVWAVDQFDTICCHTTISQKYWLRFFYLYHFIFYAYHYRFNGQYSSLALAATWFLIQHSMLYFFHNYELPAIEDEIHGRRDEEAYLDEAVQMIVEGIEMVAGQQNHAEGGTPNNQDDEQQQPVENIVDTTNLDANNDDNPTADNTNNRVREISTTNAGNRIFVFAGEGPFVQMVRDFIRQIHERVNSATNEPGAEGDNERAQQPDDLEQITEAVFGDDVPGIPQNIENVISLQNDINLQNDSNTFLPQDETEHIVEVDCSNVISTLRETACGNETDISPNSDTQMYHQITEHQLETASSNTDIDIHETGEQEFLRKVKKSFTSKQDTLMDATLSFDKTENTKKRLTSADLHHEEVMDTKICDNNDASSFKKIDFPLQRESNEHIEDLTTIAQSSVPMKTEDSVDT